MTQTSTRLSTPLLTAFMSGFQLLPVLLLFIPDGGKVQFKIWPFQKLRHFHPLFTLLLMKWGMRKRKKSKDNCGVFKWTKHLSVALFFFPPQYIFFLSSHFIIQTCFRMWGNVDMFTSIYFKFIQS